MKLTKIKLTVMALVGAAFTIFGVWDFQSPIGQEMVGQVVDIIFVVIGIVTGVGAARLKPED